MHRVVPAGTVTVVTAPGTVANAVELVSWGLFCVLITLPPGTPQLAETAALGAAAAAEVPARVPSAGDCEGVQAFDCAPAAEIDMRNAIAHAAEAPNFVP